MADDNIIIQHLRAIRGDLTTLKSGQALITEQLATIHHHMAGFFSSELRQDAEMVSIQERLARIERRLELSDE